jgi:hypothetical protein
MKEYGRIFLTFMALTCAACSHRQLGGKHDSSSLASRRQPPADAMFENDYGCRGKAAEIGPKIKQTRIGNCDFMAILSH